MVCVKYTEKHFVRSLYKEVAMKRIRDRIIAHELEEKTGKKIEYILPEDIFGIKELEFVNKEKLIQFKDMSDFEFLDKLNSNVNIYFEGIDLTDILFTFANGVNKVVIKNCKIDGLNIRVGDKEKGYYLELNKVRNDSEIKLDEQMPECAELVVIGKATTELTRGFTVEEITDKMKELVPEYMTLSADKQVILLKKQGYLSIYPQHIDITGIDKLKLLKRIHLSYMEINEIKFSEIKKYTKDIRVLDEIYFEECTFNEAPVLYKQPVRRLVVNDCNVIRKELLPNFVRVEAIEVRDTKGAELPKLNEPKLLKGLKFVSSEVNLKKIANVKALETLIILDQELDNLHFAKKLKHLKKLVVTQGKVKDTSVLKKLKKLEYIEVAADDLTAAYNELFI